MHIHICTYINIHKDMEKDIYTYIYIWIQTYDFDSYNSVTYLKSICVMPAALFFLMNISFTTLGIMPFYKDR
jgi:hypothetical protein